MASIIANEFTEATSDLYLNALIEVGLTLFVITLLINLAARLLIWRVAQRGSPVVRGMIRVSAGRQIWRKSANVIMLGLTGVCTLFVVAPLLVDSWLRHAPGPTGAFRRVLHASADAGRRTGRRHFECVGRIAHDGGLGRGDCGADRDTGGHLCGHALQNRPWAWLCGLARM